MTPVSTVRSARTRPGREADGAVIGEWDRLVAPLPSHRVIDVRLRSRVVVRGRVFDARAVCSADGLVLEALVRDASGEICLVFLGRGRIGGIEHGRDLTAMGAVGSRRGCRVVLNPIYWLHESVLEVVADA